LQKWDWPGFGRFRVCPGTSPKSELDWLLFRDDFALSAGHSEEVAVEFGCGERFAMLAHGDGLLLSEVADVTALGSDTVSSKSKSIISCPSSSDARDVGFMFQTTSAGLGLKYSNWKVAESSASHRLSG